MFWKLAWCHLKMEATLTDKWLGLFPLQFRQEGIVGSWKNILSAVYNQKRNDWSENSSITAKKTGGIPIGGFRSNSYSYFMLLLQLRKNPQFYALYPRTRQKTNSSYIQLQRCELWTQILCNFTENYEISSQTETVNSIDHAMAAWSTFVLKNLAEILASKCHFAAVKNCLACSAWQPAITTNWLIITPSLRLSMLWANLVRSGETVKRWCPSRDLSRMFLEFDNKPVTWHKHHFVTSLRKCVLKLAFSELFLSDLKTNGGRGWKRLYSNFRWEFAALLEKVTLSFWSFSNSRREFLRQT